MSIRLRAITESDLEQIRQWRMQEDITRYMNTNPKLTLEDQKKWFTALQNNADVLYRIILVDETPAGVINLTGLTKEDGILGWAYYVGEKKLRSMKLALALELSMYEFAFDVLQKKEVISDVFSLNTGVIALHKICGCTVVEEKKHEVYKENVWYDVTYMSMTKERWALLRDSKKFERIDFN